MMASPIIHQEPIMRSLVVNISLVALALWGFLSVAGQS
jgi:hypothetical protein